jgi:hypothetical protein
MLITDLLGALKLVWVGSWFSIIGWEEKSQTS